MKGKVNVLVFVSVLTLFSNLTVLRAQSGLTATVETKDGSSIQFRDATLTLDFSSDLSRIECIRSSGVVTAVALSDIEAIGVTGILSGRDGFAVGSLTYSSGTLDCEYMMFTTVSGWERPGQEGPRSTVQVRDIRRIVFSR